MKKLVALFLVILGCGGSASVDSNQTSNQNSKEEEVCNECLSFENRDGILDCLDTFDCPDEFLEALEEED